MKNELKKKYNPKNKRSKKWRYLIIFLAVLVIGFVGTFFLKTSFTISQITQEEESEPDFTETRVLPEDNPDLTNILVIGMRSGDEPGEGWYLADAMVVVSLNEKTNQVALISIPRDLYVDIYGLEGEDKHRINFAYAQCGMGCAKNTVSWVTGLHIDYGVSANFHAVIELVDAIGGVEVDLEEDFEERLQWGKEGWPGSEYWVVEKEDDEEYWVFRVSEGQHVLNGTTTLYYVRSRFSTSDFDRMRRQQQVLLSIKEKLLSLGFLTNPVKVYNLLDILGKNIRTDMSTSQIAGFLRKINDFDLDNVETLMFTSAPDDLLYETFVNGEYVLLPVGDNFDIIRQECLNIFNS